MKRNKWSRWVKATSNPSQEDIKKVWDYWNKNGGWVYVARVGNESKKLWKIGKTGKPNPFKRVMDLEKSVSATEKYTLVFADVFVNRHDSENRIHKKMKSKGLHKDKEFFHGDIEVIKSCFKSCEEDERYIWAGWDIDTWREGVKYKEWSTDPFDWDMWFEFQE